MSQLLCYTGFIYLDVFKDVHFFKKCGKMWKISFSAQLYNTAFDLHFMQIRITKFYFWPITFSQGKHSAERIRDNLLFHSYLYKMFTGEAMDRTHWAA